MFTVDGTEYTLKFNQQKLKTIETVTKVSILGEIARGGGFLPYNVLETLFSLSLVEVATNEPVKQSLALHMFGGILENNGLATTNTAIIEKLQEDMGFMFR